MQRRQVSISGVILAFVSDMKSKELYSIFEGDKLLYEDLTQDEYFSAMEDLAYEFYDNGSHNPNDLRTEIKSI